MSIFKKLFGGNNKDQGGKRPDIDTLLSSPETTNAIIEIDTFICKLCSYGETLDRLTEPQRNFYFNQNLEKEINNGGFNQYFTNSSGDFAHETIASLKSIGANKTAELLQQAINQFPNYNVPKDKAKRQEILDIIETSANEVWDELDNAFYKYEDNLYDLNIAYLKQNRSFF